MATENEFLEATVASTNVSALQPKVIDQNLLDYSRKYDPLDGLLTEKAWPTLQYFFDVVDQFPYPQAVTEVQTATQVSPTASNYNQNSFTIAHYQSRGDLGEIAIQVSTVAVGNLLMTEMQRHAKAMAWYKSWSHIFGDSVATSGTLRPQWDGFLTQVATGQKLTPSAGAGNTISLTDLDNVIDAIESIVAEPLTDLDFALITTPSMLSEISRLNLSSERLMTPTQLVRRTDNTAIGGSIVEVPSGVQVATHRGVPLLKSSFMRPRGNMTAVTATATGADGAVTTAARYYAVEVITQQGPSIAAQANVTPGATTNHVALTFTAPTITDALGKTQPNLLYRVYEGPSANQMTLIGIVPAVDAGDGAVNTITDFGNKITATGTNGSVNGHYVAASNVAGDGFSLPLLNSGEERLLCVSRYADFVVQPTLNPIKSKMLAQTNPSSIQFAVGGSCCLAMRAPLFAATIERVLSH